MSSEKNSKGASRRNLISVLVAVGIVSGCAPEVQAAIYYVDYQSGSDNATGTQPNQAWKHAPGDPASQGAAAGVNLNPGDRVRFRGGVAYRGVIRIPAGGAKDAPIVYAGDEWGADPAIIDGGDPVQAVRRCPSAEACGGARNWTNLALVEFQPPKTALIKFFDRSGPMFETQFPSPKDPFFSDNTAEYVEVPVDLASAAEQGRLKSSRLVEALGDDARGGTISFWTFGNRVVRRSITGVDGGNLLFEPDGIRFYKDRPGRAAIVNSVDLIDRPGVYAVIGPGRAVAWLRPDADGVPPDLIVGHGRGGFDFSGRSDVTIRGFTFQHYAAIKYGEGVQITNSGPVAQRVRIEGNTFRRSSLYTGAGAVMIGQVEDAIISKNTFVDLERASGIRTNRQPVVNLVVAENRFDRLGQTAIVVMGAKNSTVTKNVITRLYGVHGNGISLYLDNRHVVVSENTIVAATRPLTFHGDKGKVPGDNDLVIERNLMETSEPSAGAITSFGNTGGVKILENVLIGPRYGLLMAPTDVDVFILRNATSGIHTKGDQPAAWVLTGNRGVSRSEKDAAKAAAVTAVPSTQ